MIFENLHQISTGFFDKYNELFRTEKPLTLNGYIYGTFFKDEKEKEIKLNKLDNFLILGISPKIQLIIYLNQFYRDVH